MHRFSSWVTRTPTTLELSVTKGLWLMIKASRIWR